MPTNFITSQIKWSLHVVLTETHWDIVTSWNVLTASDVLSTSTSLILHVHEYKLDLPLLWSELGSYIIRISDVRLLINLTTNLILHVVISVMYNVTVYHAWHVCACMSNHVELLHFVMYDVIEAYTHCRRQ